VSFKTTRDILDQVKSVHRKLLRYHEDMRDEAGDETIRLLLSYLGRHERNVERALADFEEDARAALLDRWFQFTPDIADSPALRKVDVEPAMAATDVIRTVLEYDEALRRMFVELADTASRPELRELFTDLARTEKEEEKAAARLALEIEQGQ